MLINELSVISEMIAGDPRHNSRGAATRDDGASFNVPHFKNQCSKARDAWAFAVLSPDREGSLRRYFTQQMTILSDLTDSRVTDSLERDVAAELFALEIHLFTCYQRFLEQDTKLPRAVVLNCMKEWQNGLSLIKEMTCLKIANVALRAVIAEMLKEIQDLQNDKPCTPGSLGYAEIFISEISFVLLSSSCTNADDHVFDKLIDINFNHIRFFLCLEDRLRSATSRQTVAERMNTLRYQRHFFKQFKPNMAYASNWNSIGEMMHSWISEEIDLIINGSRSEAARPVAVIHKLGFNLSVAHLACLTRVFFSAGIYLSENIGDVFEFSARYFHSKKQENISKGSFSKEYYSVSQKTAAHVLGLLQKMTATLRHDYFP